jgi:membrane associated rhomboid family serine protease
VKALVIACVAVYMVQFVAESASPGSALFSRLFGLVPLAVIGLGGQCDFMPVPFCPWQIGSYMFLHGGLFHILFNMLVLWLFGSELEGFWGSRGFLTFYLVCGLGAGVLATLFGVLLPGGRPCAATIGASGAIYGLIMAFGSVFATRTVVFALIFPMQARTMAWILFAIAFLSTWDPRSGGVAHVAHLGGALTGWLYLHRTWRPGTLWRELRWRIKRRRFKTVPPRDPDDRWLH